MVYDFDKSVGRFRLELSEKSSWLATLTADFGEDAATRPDELVLQIDDLRDLQYLIARVLEGIDG